MRNKEGKAKASLLASRKARKKPTTFLFSLTHDHLPFCLIV